MTAQVIGPAPKPYDAAEVLASFDTVPLFMKSLPEETTGDSALAALQSLVHDGTPDEVAQRFKSQGNEYFKGKRFREAIGFYNQGVDAKPTDDVLLETLLLNRAACNLELQNYGSVLRDCGTVLKTNPKSSKAYYRSGKALFQLGRLDDAIDCCTRCLSFDPTNADISALSEKTKSKKDEESDKAKRKQEEIRKKEATEIALKRGFLERNLIIVNKPDSGSSPVAPHFDEQDPARSALVFPVFFLYPQYATSDIVSDFDEDTTFAAHLEHMFSSHPKWDQKKEYSSNKLTIYATTHRKRLLKVGKQMTLRTVFTTSKGGEGKPRDGLELRDNCLTFVVLPKGEVEDKWVKEYKITMRDGSS